MNRWVALEKMMRMQSPHLLAETTVEKQDQHASLLHLMPAQVLGKNVWNFLAEIT